MNRKFFELALERLRPSDWEHFEELSSAFLSSDFSSLRTMASPSGDGGRDSELFSPIGDSTIAVQYSVTGDWERKVKNTFDRISKALSGVKVLIYMSNQVVGAKADDLKRKGTSDYGIFLDVRDRNWFLERYEADDNKYEAAFYLSDLIARPFLEGEELIEKKRPALTSVEAKAALTYIGLQWEDESTDKGLTKIVYEALVRSALRHTKSDKRLSRDEIHSRIFTYIPSSISSESKTYIDSALRRLSEKRKGILKYWPTEDSFCLSHQESQRIHVKLSETEIEESDFLNEVSRLVENEKEESDDFEEQDIPEIAERVVRIVDLFLVKSGESFASSVVSGNIEITDANLLKDTIFNDLNDHPSENKYVGSFPDIAINVVTRILSSNKESINKHLKKVSDTYTLFSFLRETPDIQKVTKKIFNHAKIWLDTTVILPLLAEAFTPDENRKKFTTIVNSLSYGGVNMRVTEGVIKEILHHIRISENCSRHKPNEWQGRIPFLYYHYLESGAPPSAFSSSVEVFRGNSRPEDDVSQYLEIQHGIIVESLENPSLKVADDIRHTVEFLWREAHKRRRSNNSSDIDPAVTDTLIQHDVESYLGIIGLRAEEHVSDLGYRHWWLTIDSLAWRIRNTLKQEIDPPPMSPLISLDFLANSLSFGPARGSIDRTHEQLLPVVLDMDFAEHMPRELLEVAERVRRENEGLPEHIIKRRVRDECDKMRRRYGTITQSEVEAEQGTARG
ncbi:hypothetical protein [Microbulbifer halophilus]|uniref:Uncharacterized protein n=1 Tax=Microbulbifer halophilus TaxID=453963 RepID=A0ABW5EF85_9GAMM|nr:hypothetical protein [Microbulbifer halophilus]MCW8126578.1 hypothetical protein [Microbulbifer halophilus]